MNKKVIFIIIFTLLFFPLVTHARVYYDELQEENVYEIDGFVCPKIGEKPNYILNSEYASSTEEMWVNETDYKEMGKNDIFESGKKYSYRIALVLKDEYYGKPLAFPSYNCNNYLGGTSGGDTRIEINNLFYMGDINNYSWQEPEKTILDINKPTIGKNPPLARNNSKYSIINQKWYNATDDKVMQSNDVFEENKKYQYEITVATFYDTSNFFNKIKESEYYLGEKSIIRDSGLNYYTKKGYFYFGSKDDLIVDGTITIENENIPTEGNKLVFPTINISLDNPIIKYEEYWTINNEERLDGRRLYEINDEKFKKNEEYEYHLIIYPEPGYMFSSSTKVINNNNINNNNLVEENLYLNSQTYINNEKEYTINYTAKYRILDDGQTIGISGIKNELYKNDIRFFDYYPKNNNNQYVTWKSSNENVATVTDYGMVKAISPGNVTITVTNSNGESASIDLVVGVPVSSVKFNNKDIIMYVGETKELGVTIYPDNATNKNVTFEPYWEQGINFNDLPLKINGSEITAIKSGKMKVLANASGKQDICEVTVLEKVVEAECVDINKSNITLAVGETYIIESTVLPNNTNDKSITWESDDESVATINKNGKVTAIKEGKTLLTIRTANGKTNTCNVTVIKKLNFGDVPQDSWYYDAVKEAYARNIISGYNKTTFAPSDKVTRGQLVTFLYRLEGMPDVSSVENDFDDVEDNMYFTDGVKWAKSNKIVSGYGGTKKFGPNDPIIRQDLAVILNNYAKYKEKDYTSMQEITSFTDYDYVKGNYAEDALKWAVKNKVMSGQNLGNNKRAIAPFNNTTRAEAAAMIVNFINRFEIN